MMIFGVTATGQIVLDIMMNIGERRRIEPVPRNSLKLIDAGRAADDTLYIPSPFTNWFEAFEAAPNTPKKFEFRRDCTIIDSDPFCELVVLLNQTAG